MRFSINTTIATIAALAVGGSAFVIETYGDTNCGAFIQRVNTWDNTCANWPEGFMSFKIKTWGGKHQHAYFFAPDNCGSLPGAIGKGYVDSTTYDYKMDECYSFDGASANAIASYAG